MDTYINIDYNWLRESEQNDIVEWWYNGDSEGFDSIADSDDTYEYLDYIEDRGRAYVRDMCENGVFLRLNLDKGTFTINTY